MADHVPINPCTIPQFTGDLDALEKNKTAIDTAAGTFRDAGSNVDSEFQGLSAFYSAPEAAKLFATTKPVKTDSDRTIGGGEWSSGSGERGGDVRVLEPRRPRPKQEG